MRNPMMRHLMLFAILSLALLNGCSYGRSFSCKGYPEGVRCQDVITTYLARHELDPPGPGADAPAASGAEADEAGAGEASARPPAPASGDPDMPALTAPRVARVWIAPWRDDKNRLHEAATLYMILETSDWAGVPRRHGATASSRRGRTLVPTISSLVEPAGARRAPAKPELPARPPQEPTRPSAPTPALPPRPMVLPPNAAPNLGLPPGVPMAPMLPMGGEDTAVESIMGAPMGNGMGDELLAP